MDSSNGKRLKCLTVAGDFSHEAVDIAVDYGISGQYVIRLLDQAARFRGYPAAVRTDNGPKFISRAFIGWAHGHGIRHILIEPGRPMQNGYIESFNGRFRRAASPAGGGHFGRAHARALGPGGCGHAARPAGLLRGVLGHHWRGDGLIWQTHPMGELKRKQRVALSESADGADTPQAMA